MENVDGRGWRSYIKEQLADTGIIFFDPYIKPFTHDIPEDEESRAQMKKWMETGQYDLVQQRFWDVRGYDLRLCDICDFFIANIQPKIASWGSAEELFTINRAKKPLFLSVEGGRQLTPLWLMGTFPHKYVYDGLDEIIQTVKAIDQGIVKMNSDRWKLLKKEYR